MKIHPDTLQAFRDHGHVDVNDMEHWLCETCSGLNVWAIATQEDDVDILDDFRLAGSWSPTYIGEIVWDAHKHLVDKGSRVVVRLYPVEVTTHEAVFHRAQDPAA